MRLTKRARVNRAGNHVVLTTSPLMRRRPCIAGRIALRGEHAEALLKNGITSLTRRSGNEPHTAAALRAPRRARPHAQSASRHLGGLQRRVPGVIGDRRAVVGL